MTEQRPKRILVAGIGNAWMKDDGFGGAVAERLGKRELPSEAAVFDFGTGGLDLAYELMRGYDGLILIDVSRQGGEPGDALRDVARRGVGRRRDRGRRRSINPHGMDPQTVLRFVQVARRLAGQGRVIACEPAEVEEMGIGLSDDGRRRRRRGGRAGRSRRSTSSARTPPTHRSERVHELSLSGAIVNTVVKHAAGRRVTVVSLRVGRLRQVVPDTLEFYFGFVAQGTRLRGRAARAGARPGAAALRAPASASGSSTCRSSAARDLRRRGRRSAAAATSSRSSRSRSRRRHASHQGEGRRGGARRQQHDRAGQPGRLRPRRRDGRELHERAGRRQDHAARARPARARRRARRGARGRRAGQHGRRPPRRAAHPRDPAQHRPELRRRVPPRRQHGALGAAGAAARRARPAGDRERRQPRLPGRVPGRRGRARDGHARSPRARTSRSSTR